MMLTGFAGGELIIEERALRSGNRQVRGRFPYMVLATITNGGKSGRVRKERFGKRAFRYVLEERFDIDIRFLLGHSYDHPIASRKTGTLELTDSDEALTFVATVKPEMQEVSYVRDFFAGFSAGLIVGLSPGFSIPPKETVPDAETIEEEDPSEGRAIIRTINHAILWELSAVTNPAYKEAEIEARNWDIPADHRERFKAEHLKRWRY